MNVQSIETNLSQQELYEIFGQQTLMEFYFGDSVHLGKKYANPFREDSNPGGFFKWTKQGNLFFMDYATEKSYYSAIDIAMLRTGYDFPKILKKVQSDFQMNRGSYSENITICKKDLQYEESKPAIIKVQVTNFTQTDLSYWNQFGITSDILEKFNVKRIEKAWINDKLWYLNNNYDPCYRYKEKDRFKLYRPFCKKNSKWRGNYFAGIVEGYTQLPDKGGQLVITKGLKDVMTLSSLGINAVAVRSENTPISENAFEILKNRFNKIVLWFDADAAGIAGCKKMEKLHNICGIYHDPIWGKDPSDIYKNYGKEKLLELCRQLEIL